MSVVDRSADPGGRTFRLYVLCEAFDDEDGADWAEALRIAMVDVADQFALRQTIGESVRVSVLEFSSRLASVVPLSNPAEWRPSDLWFRPGARLDYRAMLLALGDLLERDRLALEDAGMRPARPVVLIVARCGPSAADEWRDGLPTLLDRHRFPLVGCICPAGPAMDFAAEIAYPPGVGRQYVVGAPELFTETIKRTIVAACRRLLGLDTGAGLLPEQADLGDAAQVRGAEQADDTTYTDLLELPDVLPDLAAAPAAEPDRYHVPEVFLFDYDLGGFTVQPGPRTVELPRSLVELAVRELRLGTSPEQSPSRIRRWSRALPGR